MSTDDRAGNPHPGATDAPPFSILSPRRGTTGGSTPERLAREQLAHFGIDADGPVGATLAAASRRLYRLHGDIDGLARITADTLRTLDRSDRIAFFNAKKFLSFQIAKVLHDLQGPFRDVHGSLGRTEQSLLARGPYPVFENVSAVFSANPVVVRTATYVHACTEWIDEACQGKEPLHNMYSRWLNPTSLTLAQHIVDLEAGPFAQEYMAWNFNSGMAAIDAVLGLLLRRGDVVLTSRNLYGGTHQLLHDHYADDERLAVRLEWFDGLSGAELAHRLQEVEGAHRDALHRGRRLVVYLESPCNPHGWVLDVPGICRAAHAAGHTVVLDATIGTPFLQKALRREAAEERPDFVVHSYTKDLTGTGDVSGGVVIGQRHRMFLPKGETQHGIPWDQTLFWAVYYIKGAFLDADRAFEVLRGIKTLEQRMLAKCTNTIILARFLAAHPDLRVSCNVVEGHPNASLRQTTTRAGLPAPLFTVDLEPAGLSAATVRQFLDLLSPGFAAQLSLGQTNTIAVSPASTSHSELDADALARTGISPSVIRIAVGSEDPKELIAQWIGTCRLVIEPLHPGFCEQFMSPGDVDRLVRETYLDVHRRHVDAMPSMERLLE